METPEKTIAGIAMDFPVSDDTMAAVASSYSWPPRIPRRLKRRLVAECNSNKTPSTVEEIEAKLRDADLRRQQFYEKLSSKARPKQRSPRRGSLSQEGDLGQRLEAKLQAAEQKRLSILAKEQERLAKLDEIRQAAKSEVELRLEKEREMLGTKVESRFQQAQVNRMLILNAHFQKRASLKERSSQSLMRRMARESKYKERVRAAINQKRAAAEKKRLRLLEAEQKRVCARVLQVQQVANSISQQREIERKRLQDQLEDRLQRAKRQRAEYLRQRARLRSSLRISRNRMRRQADILSRKLARCWRRFLRIRKTTFDLAKAYDALGLNEKRVKSVPFEQLAVLIESTSTIQTVKALLDRLESRLRASKTVAVASTNQSSSLDNIDHLLKRVATPKKRASPRTPLRNRDGKKGSSGQQAIKVITKLSRYPVRVVICAYMILGHPDAVLSGQGRSEAALAQSAEEFIREFELLIKIILDGPIQSSDEESESAIPKRCTFRSQLAAFDKAWCDYLNCFVVWKIKDAKLLEDDLVRAACQLELSMIQTCKITADGDSGALTHDMKAVQKQVNEDQKLLREKVLHLSGDAGIERMESALSETRSKYFRDKNNGSHVGSPLTNISSTSPASSSAGPPVISSTDTGNLDVHSERPNRVVRSLFREDITPLPDEFGSLAAKDGQNRHPVEKLVTENEVIVNAFLHEQDSNLNGGPLLSGEEDKNSIKKQIRETMERAFWESIMESVKGDEPQYDRIIQLVREVRDEICDIVPRSWKEEIIGAIDLDILSQVLRSGHVDIEYLGKILEFSLATLQKLSAPASDDAMKASHQKLMRELAEICEAQDGTDDPRVIAMIKGLRFVLEQIQALKQEITNARIRLMEPLLKGPAGFDYLRTAFTNHYGSPSDAVTSLPLTSQWLSSVKSSVDQEWNEHKSSVLSLISHKDSSQGYHLPSTTLRTGGRFVVNNGSQSSFFDTSANNTGSRLQECRGDRVDLLVRIGLVNLVTRVAGLTHDTLPETFMLNLSRLRAVQAQVQKIIVISTSILICRQVLLSEQVVTTATDMESILSKCVQRLVELLDRANDAGIEEIVEVLSDFPRAGEEVLDRDDHRSRKVVMSRMLAKSLQAGDPVFERVSHAVYLALRAVVLGGTASPVVRKLAEMALRPIGAALLTERVVEAAQVLQIAASVTVRVHEPWYTHLVDNM